MIQVKCPAAELQHPVLSPNEDDVECRIQGNLRPARGKPNPLQVKGDPVVCCAAYHTCPVWIAHKKNIELSRTVKVKNIQMNNRAEHTLRGDDHERERIDASR